MRNPQAGAVVFVVPYLGNWPLWMPLFLRSCAANPDAHFRLLGNLPLAEPLPDNVRVDFISAQEIENRVRSHLRIEFRLSDPHKICDLRPFYPSLFADVVGPYEFWGYCDLDVVFGDLSRVLSRDFLKEVDVFSAWDSRQLVGHFTLLRNSPAVAKIAFEIEDWRYRVGEVSRTTFMDEGGLTVALRAHPEVRWKHAGDVGQQFASGRAVVGATILHDGRVFEFDARRPVACNWDGRRTFVREPGRSDVEVLYIHFMGLKRPYQWWAFDRGGTMAHCSFSLLGFHDRMLELAELRSFGYRTKVLSLRCLALLVALVGRLLPRRLKVAVTRPLRRQ